MPKRAPAATVVTSMRWKYSPTACAFTSGNDDPRHRPARTRERCLRGALLRGEEFVQAVPSQVRDRIEAPARDGGDGNCRAKRCTPRKV